MSEKQERAREVFTSGFNCAQAVLTAFCEQYGLDAKLAAKLACGLGGGIRSAEVCGAVSGAVLVIGLKYGQAEPADKADKDVCYAKTVEFLDGFREHFGSIVCRDLLGCDISTSDGYAQAESQNLFTTRCSDIVAAAVGMLEDAGY